MSFKTLISKVLSGDASVQRLGSRRVAEDADPRGVVTALETAQFAQELSTRAMALRRAGRLEEATDLLFQSIVMEDANGNTWGILSDLGNIAMILLEAHEREHAENILVWLRDRDRKLMIQPTTAPGLRRLEPSGLELRDYALLYGIHSEGLARVYIDTGRREQASPLIDEAIEAYTRADSAEHVEAGKELRAWLMRQSQKG